MDDVNLIFISLIAFSAVMILLSLLAGMIHLITTLFEEKAERIDSPLVAAIGASVASVLPGAKVLENKELKGSDSA
jgi:hypothetical protein